MNPIVFYVVGSINTDISVKVDRFPELGETIIGSSVATSFGGKGANQAVALSQLCKGSEKQIFLAGKTGLDTYGNEYRHYLEMNKISTRYISRSQLSTGTALIEIDANGSNRIVVVPGANGDMDESWWTNLKINYNKRSSSIFLFQLEIPISVVCSAIKEVHSNSATVILDPAPAATLPEDIWHFIDFITPNQTETERYTGIYPVKDSDALEAGRIFLEMGVGTVIIKAGGDGAWLFSHEESLFCPVFPVNVQDTTAAGDSFNAGFAYALSCGLDFSHSLRFANAVGGLSTTRTGAQSAMPDLNTVEELLQAYPKILPRSL